jgi:hypothetical protein
MELGKPRGKVQPGASVLGWRAWAVTRTSQGVRLTSPLFDHVWLPGEPAVASCLRHEDPFAPPLDLHAVATLAECSCGFHAARDPADALSYLHGRDAPSTVCRVLGEVTLWGEVLQTEAGWRGTLAYPARLYVPDASLADELAAYGVSVSSAECGSASGSATSSTAALAGSPTNSWSVARTPSSRTAASG